MALKDVYDPDAYLRNHRNVRRGLNTRTKILNILRRSAFGIESGKFGEIGEDGEEGWRTTQIMNALNMSRSAVLRHLHMLREEGVIAFEKSGRGFRWKRTGKGQKRLNV